MHFFQERSLRLVCLSCFFFITFSINNQQIYAQKVVSLDSLANALTEYSTKDANRVGTLIQYAAQLDGVNAQLMRKTAEEAFSISEQIADSSLMLESLFYVGLSKFNAGELKDAYACFGEIESSFNANQIETIFANAISGKAKVYNAYGRITDALENYLSALNVFEQTQKTERVADTQHEIGIVYTKQGNFDEALNYYSSAIESYGKSGNLRKMAFICVNKADLVRDLGRYDEALIGYQDALGVFEKYGYFGGASLAHLNMGKLYLKNGDLPKCEQSLMQADTFNKKEGNVKTRLAIDLALADLYLVKRTNEKAQLFYQKAYDSAVNLSLLDEQLAALNGLKTLASRASNYVKALRISDQVIQLTDSLNSINLRTDLDAVKSNHELELSENQNMILQKEKDLQQVELLRQKEVSAKQNAVTIGIIVVLVIISVFSIFMAKAYRNQKQLGIKLSELNDKIALQNASLESANVEISSMNEKLEQRVKERTQSLIDKNAQLEKYAFKHSHELRAPLSRLMGLVELVKLDAFENPDELKVMVNGLDQSALELDVIIRQMAEELDKRTLFVDDE